MKNFYDIIIIGGGPAGLTSAIYALRGGCSVALIEKEMIGGQATLTYEISNYPGFEEISGTDLAMRMHAQAEKLGLITIYGNTDSVNLQNKQVCVDGQVYTCTSIILAMGAKERKLGLANENSLIGKGVAYCAVCDGAFYRDKNVVLVGGGNTAMEDGIYLSNIAKKLTVVNNLPQFICQQTLLEKFEKVAREKKIDVFQNSTITEILGNDKVVGVEIATSDKKTKVVCDGLFIAIGRVPDCDVVKGQVSLSNEGYIVAGENLQTSVVGVYAAGDVRVKSLRQIATAVGDGAIAGTEASAYVSSKK